MPKAGYYAVKIGKRPGIYTTWEDCREQVDGYPRARYKKLRTVEEAEAWIQGSTLRGSAIQTSPVEQRHVPYPVRPKIRTTNQARALIGSQTSVPVSASLLSPTVEPVSTGHSESVLQPTAGLSNAVSRATAGQSKTTRSNLVAAELVVYTDGACSGNGQSGSVAGIGVWWGSNDTRNLSERCPGRQTNNRAELIAIIRALETTPMSSVPLVIKSDSEYAIKCFTDWLPIWRRKNFITSQGTPVKNVKLIMYMDALFSTRGRTGQEVRIEHVRGHAGEVGNEGADALAVHGAKLREMYADIVLDERDLLAELEGEAE
ncbi:ribonuclease H-like domain-containing protein [Russula earlei]|uniref:Ribonuclease H-like domain-containing protein n=1 Tax=Russula earlei TaxID=71964 RepID=A0ACC0UKC0_9AGAM|nr:ribonuclease H-like domain-containing protein [Russula earlei]